MVNTQLLVYIANLRDDDWSGSLMKDKCKLYVITHILPFMMLIALLLVGFSTSVLSPKFLIFNELTN